MIYKVVIIEHTARAGKLYMGESENIWNSFKSFFVGYAGHCAYTNL
jgi:hypothetical protein